MKSALILARRLPCDEAINLLLCECRERQSRLFRLGNSRMHTALSTFALISMFGAQPLEDPLGCVPLLARSLLVVFQDRVDHALPRAQLRPPRRLLPW